MSLVTWTKLSFQRTPTSCVGIALRCVRVSPTSAVPLITGDACLLRGNTLDLKPFLCPQAGYLWYIGLVQPSLNCLCPQPADTSYNGDIDVLLRNPWVRIKELLAARRGSGRVCELRIMFSFSIRCVHDCCCSLGPMRKKKEVISCNITY